MPGFGARLRRLRQDRGMNQKELGAVLGLTGAAISAYELGKNQPDFSILERIAGYFGVSVDYLLGRTEHPHGEAPAGKHSSVSQEREGDKVSVEIELDTLPILGRIRAGIPLLAEQNIIGHIEVPAQLKRKADFALEVTGDSMIGAGIQEGDIVFLRLASKQMPLHGNIVAAMVDNGDMTLKRYVKRNGQYWLVAENPAYPPIPVDERVQVQGVYVARYTENEGLVDPPIEDMNADELITRLARMKGLNPDLLADMVEVLAKRHSPTGQK